jgi:sugar lactone lactonase YvrE
MRLATDAPGNIYVADFNAGGVLKYDSTGTFVKKYLTPKAPTGVAIDQNGDLLVSQGTYVVVIGQPAGNEKARFGTFKYADGIAVDAVGNIYVTDALDDCVQKFDLLHNPVTVPTASAGHPVNSFGTYGTLTGQFKRPTGISYEKASGLLAVVDFGNGRIQYFDTVGTYNSVLGSYGTINGKFVYPQGISFEYDNGGALYRIYVSDTYRNNVQVFNGTDRVWLANIGGYGFDAGKLFTPRDLLFDQYNSLNKRLFVVNGSGNIAIFGCSN